MKKTMTHLPNFGMIIIVTHSHFQNGIFYSEKNWPDKDKLTNINLHL